MSFRASADNNYMQLGFTAKPTQFSASFWAKKVAASPGGSGIVLGSATVGGSLDWWMIRLVDGTTPGHAQPSGFFDWTVQYAWNAPNNPETSDLTSWKHCAVTYDGSSSSNEPKIYVNGSLISSSGSAASSSGVIVQTANPWYMFRRGSNDGLLDSYLSHVAIFDRPLTSGQVTALAAGRNAMDVANVGSNPVFYNMMIDAVTGTNAQVGTLTNFGVANFPTDNPTVDAPPAPTLTKKWSIPTNVADGIARKLFVWSDTTLNTLLVGPVNVTSAGGTFKGNDSGLTVGQVKPAALLSHGTDDTQDAKGGPCWATGIQE